MHFFSLFIENCTAKATEVRRACLSSPAAIARVPDGWLRLPPCRYFSLPLANRCHREGAQERVPILRPNIQEHEEVVVACYRTAKDKIRTVASVDRKIGH